LQHRHNLLYKVFHAIWQQRRHQVRAIGAFIDNAGACYSGKNKDHTVKNVLLVNALLLLLFLSDTYGGRTHEKPIADTTPSPLLAGSRL
jgi:hypothetical protein